MRILLDNNVSYRFGKLLAGHDVTHVQDIDWERLKNGELLAAAEQAGYSVMITADKQMQYQQNLKDRKISIIVLGSWRITLRHIKPLAAQVQAALKNLQPGSFITIRPTNKE